MTIEQIDPIAAVRKQRLKKGTWKAERRRLSVLEKKVGWLSVVFWPRYGTFHFVSFRQVFFYGIYLGFHV